MKRNVAILENPKESLVKKRCLMKTSLGNYRHQMEKEKSKLTLGINFIVFNLSIYLSNNQFDNSRAEKCSNKQYLIKHWTLFEKVKLGSSVP